MAHQELVDRFPLETERDKNLFAEYFGKNCRRKKLAPGVALEDGGKNLPDRRPPT